MWFRKFNCFYQHCHKPLPQTVSDPGSANVTNPYYRLDLIEDVLLSQTPTRGLIWSRKCYCHKPLLEVWSDPGSATVTNPYQRLDLIQEVLLSQNLYQRLDLTQEVLLSQIPTKDWIWSRKCYCHKPLPETGSDPGSATVTKPLPQTGSDPGSATVTNPY